ncbi:translocation and assembly module lipoprotein TamL [Wenyingzhuangia sp. IMCC45533]
MKTVINYFLIFIVVIFSFTSCNTTKYVKENEQLLEQNIINIDGEKNSDQELNSYIIQRPNTKLLGIPLGLMLYNIGDENYDSIHQRKLIAFKDRNNFFDKLLSKKQTLNIINKRNSVNRWFLNKGEAPVIIDTDKTNKSASNLRNLYFNQGYFNATTKITVLNNVEKATVTYNVTKNKPFYIGDISYDIKSKSADSLIQKNKHIFALRKGDQYNIKKFKKTVSKISNLLRNNGFYHFNESLISFRDIDTLATDNTTPVKLVVENLKTQRGKKITEIPLNVQTIKNINVYTDYTYNRRNIKYDVLREQNKISFFAHSKIKHRTKTLANSIFIEPNKVYSDKKVELTRNHLRSLKNFKSIRINHKELPNNQLNTNIILTPLKKYGVGVNTELIHSNIKQIGLSGGFSFINRNLFKGAEIFQLSFQGSIFDTATNIAGDERNEFDAFELSVDASLEFPRVIFPFLSNVLPREMTPRTKITVGTSFQRNIGLDKQNLSGIVNYNWKSSSKNSHVIELINLQFINNLNPESYYNIYNSEFRKIREIQPLVDPTFNLTPQNADEFIRSVPLSFRSTNPEEFTSIQNIGKREDIITSNNIIPSFSYSFEHNSRKGLSDTRYNYFRTRISSAGNLNTFFLKEVDGQKTFRDISVSQFVKLDVDFRKFWSRSINHSLAFRTFVGVAVPTGKNKDIPFITSYFAGGSNDIRAWKTYELGPGNSNTGLEFNIGNLKLLSNLEYRFKMINSIHGAVFIDAGNIWNLPSSTAATDEEIFSGFESLENIAIGSGFGIRYDFNFLVLRLDLAFKTFEPYLESNKWFSNYDLRSSVLNIGINYPF